MAKSVTLKDVQDEVRELRCMNQLGMKVMPIRVN